MKKDKELIFHGNDVPKYYMGQIHTLVLHLFTKDIIDLTELDKTTLRQMSYSRISCYNTAGKEAGRLRVMLIAYIFTGGWIV